MGREDDVDDESEDDVFKPRKSFTKIKGKTIASEGNASQNTTKTRQSIGKKSHSKKNSKSNAGRSRKKAEIVKKYVTDVQCLEQIAGPSKSDHIISIEKSVKKESRTDLFCPICQVPLNLLKISAAMHTASCNVSGNLPGIIEAANFLCTKLLH